MFCMVYKNPNLPQSSDLKVTGSSPVSDSHDGTQVPVLLLNKNFTKFIVLNSLFWITCLGCFSGLFSVGSGDQVANRLKSHKAYCNHCL